MVGSRVRRKVAIAHTTRSSASSSAITLHRVERRTGVGDPEHDELAHFERNVAGDVAVRVLVVQSSDVNKPVDAHTGDELGRTRRRHTPKRGRCSRFASRIASRSADAVG
jgi:hypothetical protein